MLVTTGSLLSSCRHEFSAFLTFLVDADLITFDEAQQWGTSIDAWILATNNGKALGLLFGDRKQPPGAAGTKAGQLLLAAQNFFKPGMFLDSLNFAPPSKMMETIQLVDPSGRTYPKVTASQCLRLLSEGATAKADSSVQSALGISHPSPLFTDQQQNSPLCKCLYCSDHVP